MTSQNIMSHCGKKTNVGQRNVSREILEYLGATVYRGGSASIQLRANTR